ncbi:MAG: aspartate carbamoyltransferase regulatory subunit [Halobacteriota archaeon]|nr:aspartate carbamoyltransferase regulatory subunit [Halobacteriota archaeon]
MNNRELRIEAIRSGTVIDHIMAGHALQVLNILGIAGRSDAVVSVAMNVPSERVGTKDIVKVEERELITDEVNKIALIAPNATINIIRDYEVIEKNVVHLPDLIEGIISCPNPDCISNTREPILSSFIVHKREPLQFRCYYCEGLVENVADYLLL